MNSWTWMAPMSHLRVDVCGIDHAIAPNSSREARSAAPLRRPGAAGLVAAVRLGGGARRLHGVLRRLEADRRVVDLLEAVDQLDPLVGLEHGVDLLGGLRVGAVERLPPHVDVVVVVAEGERVVRTL